MAHLHWVDKIDPWSTLTYDKHDWCGDHAQDDDVVDGHTDQPGVVDLPDLHRPRLVRQEQAQHQL